MAPVFLIGGGRDGPEIRASHEGLVRASGGGPIAAVVLDGGAPRVDGIGSAYRVARDVERLGVTVTRAWSGARTES